MHLTVPDPDPGRCLNVRHDTGPYGKARRCLEREGTRHECRFPPVPDSKTGLGWAESDQHAYTKRSTPQPWVVPPPEKKE